MRSNFLLILFIAFISKGFSQSLSGTVTDTERQAIEFATVSLLNAGDSTLVTGTVSDIKGRFHLRQLQEGSYVLSIKFLGYNASRTLVQVRNGQNLNVGMIQLKANAKALNEVTITGTKAETSHKIDKQVYSAGQFQSSLGGTALDVVKNTPSVSVNAEGDISLRGSTGLLVLLNGKPVQASPKEILNQLPANTIENIEVVTAPSAKYDPDGKSGIINIVTKKGTANVSSFSASTQGGFPSVQSYNNLHAPQRYGADAIANVRRDKWDLALSGSYLRNDLAGRRVGDVNTTIDNIYTSFPSVGERSFKRYGHTVRASIGYTPNKNNTFSIGFYNGRKTQYRRADILYNNTKTDLNTGNTVGRFTYFNSNLVRKIGDFSLANIDFTHTFANQSSLSLSGLYEYGKVDSRTENLNQAYPNSSQTIQNVRNNGRNPLDAFRLKADYAINIGKGKLETGYQYRLQEQNGVFLYEDQNLSSGDYLVVPEFSSNADLKNEIHSLYSQYSGKANKLDYVAGLRYEYATRVFTGKEPDPYNLELSNFFPSLNLLYSVQNTLKLKAGYSKRVQRSTNNELNPYPEREHSETLEQGDPKIRPEFVGLAELGLIKDFRKGSVSLTLYNQNIRNVINRVNSVYNDTILNRIFTNAGKANLWGAELGTNFKPVKWYQFYIGANIYDYTLKGSLFNNEVSVNSSSWVYSINTNSNIQLNKNTSFQWNVNYLSERVTAQGKDSRYVIPNASLRKNFWKGKASATIQWQNIDLGIFNTNEQRITTWGRNFYTTTNYIQEKDLLLLNLSINLNQLAKKLKLPSSEFGEREF
ncbi:TonB-dependent receptor domain-containing protein [Desertivirga brevis]|uniref:TonB-dependent receptor domain-containing protein n=1 Tax=Desertivirga brevis TaxID=2810310 RepID=UPI001A965829|nr:TonB-dependent receptor [Pedobacter sp. SYSU D00873]